MAAHRRRDLCSALPSHGSRRALRASPNTYPTPASSHQRRISSRQNPASPRTRIRVPGQRRRICGTAPVRPPSPPPHRYWPRCRAHSAQVTYSCSSARSSRGRTAPPGGRAAGRRWRRDRTISAGGAAWASRNRSTSNRSIASGSAAIRWAVPGRRFRHAELQAAACSTPPAHHPRSRARRRRSPVTSAHPLARRRRCRRAAGHGR